MAYVKTGLPVGRPSLGFSRRKWSECVKSLKSLIANPKTLTEHKLRGVELLLQIYGIEAPQTKTDKLAIKELLMRRTFDQTVAAESERRVAEQEANQEQEELTQAEIDDQEAAAAIWDKALA